MDPVVALSYSPGRSFIPFIQSACPATISATLKSFDGKRDITFLDLILADDGHLIIQSGAADTLLERISSWVQGIAHVIEQDSQARAKRLGYNGHNEHFETQLLDAVSQILSCHDSSLYMPGKIQINILRKRR